MAWPVQDGRGKARQAWQGVTRRGLVRQGLAGLVRRGEVRRGDAGMGKVILLASRETRQMQNWDQLADDFELRAGSCPRPILVKVPVGGIRKSNGKSGNKH